MRMSDVVFGFIWQVLFTHDNVVSFYSIFGALLVISSIFVLILSKESPAQAAASKSKSKGKDVELREGGGGGESYSVLHTDEDMDASTVGGQTAIDISSHSEASEKSWDREEGEVRRNPLRGDVEDIDDIDLYDEDKGVLATFGPRKRQNSAGCEPAAVQSVDVATMKARLNDAIRG